MSHAEEAEGENRSPKIRVTVVLGHKAFVLPDLPFSSPLLLVVSTLSQPLAAPMRPRINVPSGSHELVDEYALMIHPLVIGRGKRLFPEGSPQTPLRPLESASTTAGVLIASYAQTDR